MPEHPGIALLPERPRNQQEQAVEDRLGTCVDTFPLLYPPVPQMRYKHIRYLTNVLNTGGKHLDPIME